MKHSCSQTVSIFQCEADKWETTHDNDDYAQIFSILLNFIYQLALCESIVEDSCMFYRLCSSLSTFTRCQCAKIKIQTGL